MSHPGCLTTVTNQRSCFTCWAHATSDSVYGRMYYEGTMKVRKGSVQELAEFVHLYYPVVVMKYDDSGHLIHDDRGYPNSLVASCEYIKQYGFAYERSYPLQKSVRRRLAGQQPRGKKYLW